MHTIGLSSSIVISVIDDPSQLSSPNTLGISGDMASFILNKGYTKGFRTIFILNASLTAVATLASIILIKHKELTRDDEEKLKQKATEKEASVPVGRSIAETVVEKCWLKLTPKCCGQTLGKWIAWSDILPHDLYDLLNLFFD